MKTILISLTLTAVFVSGFLFYFSSSHGAWLREKFTGQHQLVPVRGESGDIEYWTCTMHPSVRMQEPGKCPICGMDLVPVKKKGPAVASAESRPTAESGAASEAGADAGLEAAADNSVFTVDPRRQQLINIQTTTVQPESLRRVIRTVANLSLDETQIRRVNPKIKGWIEKVFVNFTLQQVQKGDPLFSVYSPELVATQQEYLLAVRTAADLGQSSFDFVSKGARSLLEATRRRLELFDVTGEQIRQLEQTGEVKKSLVVYSPVSGHVLEKNAFENMYVTPETHVYTIADHTRIWAQAEVYENEIPYVRVGQTVTMTVPTFPGETFRGKISYIYPHLNKKTRTMEARLEFPNPDLKLKPEMYANVEIQAPVGERLAIPESAVLRTGTRDLVFVDLGGGSMQLRRVELGARAGGHYEILKGLQRGEKVVSAANFLIDAESKVQGVEASWETPRPRKTPSVGGR
ncbi:MAG: efflux RND transporter periplasmic adaptor subunit [Acidobacteria bacterium]|nr:efflux RND transporter periplasmic adaptor subunit [Acidobacteriota bacterium]